MPFPLTWRGLAGTLIASAPIHRKNSRQRRMMARGIEGWAWRSLREMNGRAWERSGLRIEMVDSS